MSRILALRARLIEIGISKMVMMVDMRKVENIIIVQDCKVQGSGFKVLGSGFSVQRSMF
jgi:hypothetical protein